MSFRGKTNSSLIVKVHNGERQCFIKENGALEDNHSIATDNYTKRDIGCKSSGSHCDSGVQVTDGRYASTYQITHCHVSPTSPTEEVSEFPLQRKLLNSGDSHFKIGSHSGVYPRSCEELRKDNLSPETVAVTRLKHPDQFLTSLRKYSNLSGNRTLEIVEKLNRTKHAKHQAAPTAPITKDASCHANKITEEPNAFEKVSDRANSVRPGESHSSDISKWMREERTKWRKPLTTAIDVKQLQSRNRKDKGLRSVTLPNISISVGPPFTVEDNIDTNESCFEIYNDKSSLPEVNIFKHIHGLEEVEIQTESLEKDKQFYENDVTRSKRDWKIPETCYLNNSFSTNVNLENMAYNAVTNEDARGSDYLPTLFESCDVEYDSNDEFLKDAIQRWLNIILLQTGRCTDTRELNFIFQYLYKRLKILKEHDYLMIDQNKCELRSSTGIYGGDNTNAIVQDDKVMSMAIDTLTDVLMEKIRTMYKKKSSVNINSVNRNLKIKEILPKLEDDFNLGRDVFKDANLQIQFLKDGERNNLLKKFDRNQRSNSFTNIQEAIEEWLHMLHLPKQLQFYKRVAILSLASEIKKRQDRQDFIQSRSSSHVVSDEIELDYFKYLIFKWNNKFFHSKKLEALENVKTLFYRIQDVKLKNSFGPNEIDPMNNDYPILMQDNVHSAHEEMKIKENYLNSRKITPVSISNRLNQNIQCFQVSNIKNLTFDHDPYEEYEQFIRFWIQEITKDVFAPQEADVAEKAALGLYNGIWKAIVKLNYKDDIYFNHFHYEDHFEKEIDELIDCLPQTAKLRSKRHILKVRLIEKTLITMKYICKERVMSLKNKLILKVLDYLDPLKVNDIDSLKSIKPNITDIAEMFLLWNKYLKENQEKVYHKKLLKKIESLFNVLKQKYSGELNTLDVETFQKSVINQMQEIVFTKKCLSEEVDKILLGLEIDQWFFDLASTSNNIFDDECQERVMKDILITLIKQMDNNTTLNDGDRYSKLHADICNLLKNNLLKEENINIDFLASELINRIENLRKSHPMEVADEDGSNVNSLSFAEKITKYKVGLRDNENFVSNVCDCRDIITADDTLRHIPDETIENSILHTCSAFKGPNVSVNQKTNTHTLKENTVHSDNSENSMKTALDSDVQHSNSDSKVDQQTQEQKKTHKKCFCKKTTPIGVSNTFYMRDVENALSVHRFNDANTLPGNKRDLNISKVFEDDIDRHSVRECQTSADFKIEERGMASCNKRENSRDMGINVLMNRSMCNCMLGSDQEPSNSDASGSKGRCHCTNSFRNYRNVFHSQIENGEHPPFIPVLYPYPYFF